jgi:hypothetical protein
MNSTSNKILGDPFTGNARALAQRIKKSTGYTTAIGDQLQIEGPENSVDMTQQAPVLFNTAKAGGVVEVGFNKWAPRACIFTASATATRPLPISPAKPIHPMWTTGPWPRRASRRRVNTKPCSSSANLKSAWKAMSPRRRQDHEGIMICDIRFTRTGSDRSGDTPASYWGLRMKISSIAHILFAFVLIFHSHPTGSA